MFQPIPSHKFIIDVSTKFCKIWKQLGWSHFLKSYVMSDKSKSQKNEYILPICAIKNNNNLKKLTTYSFTPIHH